MKKINLIDDLNSEERDMDIVKYSISPYLYNKPHLNSFYTQLNTICNEIYKSIFLHRNSNNYLK